MAENNQLAAPARGAVARQEFGAQEMAVSAETAGNALAAQAKALVEARFIMAMRRPRDWNDVRAKLKEACERPGFAGALNEKVWGAAWYKVPKGDGIEGFSIRFAEEAARAMGNLDIQTVTVYEDDARRICTVVVMDLETNVAFPTSISIEKIVERRFLPKGETALRVRTNSDGRPVYTLRATEDEVFSRQQNLVSKAIRNGVLRLLPGDIQAECRTRILQIREGDIAKDPQRVVREVCDAFAGLRVPPSGLRSYLGHEIAIATPAELADLRDLYKAIKAGATTWVAALDQALAERGEEPAPAESETAAAPTKPGIAGLTEKLQAQAQPTPAQQPTKGCDHQVVANDLDTCPPTSVVTCRACGEEVPGRLTQAAADQLAAAQERVPAEAEPTKAKSTNSGKGQRKLEE